MKTAFQILKRDLKRLLRNPFAALVVVGVCILPSLYAWFNIAANMDPYSNTQGIKVAVVNNDMEASTDKLTLDAGAEIVKNLKENDQLGWTFVDEKKALDGVKSGTFYAAIVLPENFSSSLLSIISGTPTAPKLDYYINEKKNAIAPKITDTGAGTVQQEINDTFSSVAADTVSRLIIQEVSKVSGSMDTMNSEVLKALSDIHRNLNDYQTVLKDFQSTVGNGAALIQDTVQTLDQVGAAARSGSDTLDSAASILSSSRDSVGAFSSAFSKSISDSDLFLNDIYSSTSLKLGAIENEIQTANGSIGESISSVQHLIDVNTGLLNDLQEISNQISEPALSALISAKITDLQAQNDKLQDVLNTLKDGNDRVSNTLTSASDTRTQLESIVSQSRQSLQNYRNQFDQTMLPQLNQSLDTFSTLSGSLSATMSGIAPSVEELKGILEQLKDNLSESSSALSDTGSALQAIDKRLLNLMTDLTALESSSAYQEFLSLEGIDSQKISSFMSSPVTVDTKAIYPVKNYGSAMTPFYTNLALWVGGLILVSIFKQEVDRNETIPIASVRASYFGRYFLFLMLGLVQSVIVCLGDIWLLKAQCVQPVAFLAAGMVCSVVYVSLIYALALAFKHVGKALCVLLVILQIPGSSGTYPIEMTPEFFQNLHPFLPFTYGINAMRETIAGMYGHTFRNDLLILSVFLAVALIIGLGLRPLLINLNHLFDKKLAATDLMLCETESTECTAPQVSMFMHALLNDERMRTELADKAARFEAGYKRNIRIGFFTILILPLVFLILMFSLESKLVFLVLWIVSIILLAVYLIVMEYIHDKMQRQLELANLSSGELIARMKKGNEKV